MIRQDHIDYRNGSRDEFLGGGNAAAESSQRRDDGWQPSGKRARVLLLIADVFAFSNEYQVREPWAYAHPNEKDDNSRGEFKRCYVRNRLHGWLRDSLIVTVIYCD